MARKSPSVRNTQDLPFVLAELSAADLRDLRGQIAALAQALQSHGAHTLADAIAKYEQEYLTRAVLRSSTIDWRSRAIARLTPWKTCPIDQDWRPVAIEIYRRFPKPTASLTVATLARILSLAAVWGWRQSQHRLSDLARIQSPPRDRVLSPTEMAALDRAIGRLSRTTTKIPSAFACLRLIMLRGLRVSEAAGITWDQLSHDCTTLTLAESKVGPRVYELGAAAAALLISQPRGKRHVFPGEEPGRSVTTRSVQALMRDACKRAKIVGATVHTLRHTWATVAIASGVPIDAVSKALGHASVKTTLRYLHTNREAVRGACATVEGVIARWLDQAKPRLT